MKVLLIVDPLNDFCPGGSLPVPEGDKIMEVVNRLAENGGFDLVVALKEQHPSDHISFASNHPGRSVFEQIVVQGRPQTLWPNHCVEGTKGAEFHPLLKPEFIDHVVLKGTASDVDSYSGFFDNQKKRETELRALLLKEAARAGAEPHDISLTVCGLALDYCVKATALDGATLAFPTAVVLDACRAVNLSPGDDLKALRELTAAGVEITESRALLPEQSKELPIARPQAIPISR